LNLNRTIITTTAMIATAVLTMTAVSDMETNPSNDCGGSGDARHRG
jgi:hypothetical protein